MDGWGRRDAGGMMSCDSLRYSHPLAQHQIPNCILSMLQLIGGALWNLQGADHLLSTIVPSQWPYMKFHDLEIWLPKPALCFGWLVLSDWKRTWLSLQYLAALHLHSHCGQHVATKSTWVDSKLAFLVKANRRGSRGKENSLTRCLEIIRSSLPRVHQGRDLLTRADLLLCLGAWMVKRPPC